MKYRIFGGHKWLCPDGSFSKNWEERRLFDSAVEAVMYVRLLDLRDVIVYEDRGKSYNDACDERRVYETDVSGNILTPLDKSPICK